MRGYIDKCTIVLKMYIQNESAPRIPSVSVHSFSLICEIHGNAEEWFVLVWFGRLGVLDTRLCDRTC
jgi:hypothetical protein